LILILGLSLFFVYRDSNYDQNAKWILDLEKNRDIRSKLALEVFAQHDTKDKQFRESLQISENKVNDGK